MLISVCTPCCPVALSVLLFDDGTPGFRSDFVHIVAFVAVLYVLGVFLWFPFLGFLWCACSCFMPYSGLRTVG